MLLIEPSWSASSSIKAFTSTRPGGVSQHPYRGLNLAYHVGDDPSAVSANIQSLSRHLHLPHPPIWLQQVHGTKTVDACALDPQHIQQADVVYTNTPHKVAGILTADCLPIVIRSAAGDEVAVVHAGWRGLLRGVVAAALDRFSAPRRTLQAWLGPGISVDHYTVDEGFRHTFLASDTQLADTFKKNDGRWHADLAAIAAHLLHSAGVKNLSHYRGCTYAEADRFYSHRRDGTTGRMATLAWIEDDIARPAPACQPD